MLNKNLQYYKTLAYKIIIEPEEFENDKWFVAYADEFGKYSCYGRGDTPEEAIKNFYEEKDNFLEYLYNSKKNIPEPKHYNIPNYSGVFNVRTSPIIHAELVKQATNLNISLNLYLNQILSAAVENKKISDFLTKKLLELELKIDKHHSEISKQMKFQNEKLNKLKWNPEYSDEPYLKIV